MADELCSVSTFVCGVLGVAGGGEGRGGECYMEYNPILEGSGLLPSICTCSIRSVLLVTNYVAKLECMSVKVCVATLFLKKLKKKKRKSELP